MGQSVLVPLDGSEQAWEAFDYAIEEGNADSLTVIHVITRVDNAIYVDTLGGFSDRDTHKRATENAEKLCEQARKRVLEAGFEAESFDSEVQTGRPTRTIISYVERNNIDHVVMGSRGLTGIKRILLGSVAENVVRRSPVPVTVVR
jgi:nucleotide-binding universal stress UspA family protein